MVRADICYLITEEQGVRGVSDRPEPGRRDRANHPDGSEAEGAAAGGEG